MTGRLIDMSLGRNRKQRITMELDCDWSDSFDQLFGQELSIEIKKFRAKRSLNANSYFHVLVNKIAVECGRSDEAVKRDLVLDYGVVARAPDGRSVGIKIPTSVNAEDYYSYVRQFDTRTENGVEFGCYLVYKHTSQMDTKEMAHLIDGAIAEAKELGIETDTPETLARLKNEWR